MACVSKCHTRAGATGGRVLSSLSGHTTEAGEGGGGQWESKGKGKEAAAPGLSLGRWETVSVIFPFLVFNL